MSNNLKEQIEKEVLSLRKEISKWEDLEEFGIAKSVERDYYRALEKLQALNN